MTDVRRLHRRWKRDLAYRRAYDELAEGFAVAQAMIAARTRAGLTQAEIAKEIKTTPSAIARLESGRLFPSMRTLHRYAKAIGCRLAIRLVPIGT